MRRVIFSVTALLVLFATGNAFGAERSKVNWQTRKPRLPATELVLETL